MPIPSDKTAECLRKVKEAETALIVAKEALLSATHDSTEDHETLLNGAHTAHSTRQITTSEEKISSDEREKCKKVFQRVDKDGSGKVGIMELKRMLEEAREGEVPDEEFDKIKSKLIKHDTDQDGQLDFEEFCKAFGYTKAQRKALEMAALDQSVQEGEMDELNTEQYVQINGVKTSAVKKYLRKELDENSAFLQLPQACLIFIFFVIGFQLHFPMERLHGVDQAITWDIKENANFAFSGIVPYENGRMGHKTVEDVNSIADFWSWMNMGLVPLFWPSGWDVNEVRGNVAASCQSKKEALEGWGGYEGLSDDTPGPDTGRDCAEGQEQDALEWPQDTLKFFRNEKKVDGTYLLYHNILGGLRLRQERIPLIDCNPYDTEVIDAVHDTDCATVTKSQNYWLMPELYNAIATNLRLTDQTGGENYYLLVGDSQADIRKETRKLENRLWFSPQTSKIELLFPTYNPHEDMVTATYVLFFLNRGGHIHKIVEPVSFIASPYRGWGVWIVDVIWMLLTIKLFLEEGWELIKHWRQLGFLKGTKVYMSLANAVDWVSIFFAVAIVIQWILICIKLADLQELMKRADFNVRGSWAEEDDRSSFFSLMDTLVQNVHDFRTVLAIYPFIIVSRFFKAFASQPRLAMVTNTLSKASIDIIHFGVVFLAVFMVFTVSAMILWGQELEYFANLARSIITVFRVLNGDYDWADLHSVGRPQAALWFVSFVVIVSMIMMNMLLAIIMDVYTEVKGGIGKAETLWSQAREICYRWHGVWSGRDLSLRSVLKALDPTDLEDEDDEADGEDEALFVHSFCEKVPKLSEDQSTAILIDARRLQENDDRPSETLTDMTKKVQSIDLRTKRISEQIAALISLQNGQRDGLYSASSVTI